MERGWRLSLHFPPAMLATPSAHPADLNVDIHEMPYGLVSLVESVKGVDAGILECGGRGTCDPSTGLCTCFPTWYSSDGRGNMGLRGDCGHFDIVGYKAPARAGAGA